MLPEKPWHPSDTGTPPPGVKPGDLCQAPGASPGPAPRLGRGRRAFRTASPRPRTALAPPLWPRAHPARGLPPPQSPHPQRGALGAGALEVDGWHPFRHRTAGLGPRAAHASRAALQAWRPGGRGQGGTKTQRLGTRLCIYILCGRYINIYTFSAYKSKKKSTTDASESGRGRGKKKLGKPNVSKDFVPGATCFNMQNSREDLEGEGEKN